MVLSYFRKMKIGILGGGQLGRMLLQASANYVVDTFILENDENCPAAHFCKHFIKGDITDFETVYKFGKNLDAITIEIENVNVEALEKLEAEGVKVYPKPSAIKTIKNKILQKEFYNYHQIPTAPFVITQNKNELLSHVELLPAVHKLAQGGYDGKGVTIITAKADMDKGFDAPSILEKAVKIKKEIAVIVAMGVNGDTAIYPPVEMIFDPVFNLLDYQLCPANLAQQSLWRVEAIALKIVKELNSPGLFAIELFVDEKDEILVNETAPRVHNSGHHTIEGNYSSQFDMLWRIMLQLPLGNTEIIYPSALINIIGAENHTGNAVYEGLDETLKIEKAFVHLYGKQQTKPGRKMGHVTVLSNGMQDLKHYANKIKHTLKVVTK